MDVGSFLANKPTVEELEVDGLVLITTHALLWYPRQAMASFRPYGNKGFFMVNNVGAPV
jgi:hypothetical protein